GYHMGDYFKHWIKIGVNHDESKLPKIFFVNWFRKNEAGKFIWPGYGENSRVLAWIFDRCAGTGKAVDTPIGFLPTPDALSRPQGVSEEDMKEILKVDIEGWKAEIADVRQNHYPKFGEKLPPELYAELDAIEKRLGV
ncbi:MAG: phosphoenolpyruvate carboxykinase (GTP), partial [Treponema sp.]|nr:phosphoenolpyruvate carboxykinase (GTP) [Treponema sp.]